MAESKNQTIQIMRGIAIAIVLLRHAIAQVNRDAVLDVAEQIIICFHMPVFFVIAVCIKDMKPTVKICK